MNRRWMYNANRRSQKFIDGVHLYLSVSEANKWNGFMCCPCALFKNAMDYASMTLHEHLFRLGFMSSYICWTKHEENMVIVEDNEEEEDDDILGVTEYVAFYDTAMGEAEEEVAVEDEPADDLVRPFMMHSETAIVKRRGLSSSTC